MQNIYEIFVKFTMEIFFFNLRLKIKKIAIRIKILDKRIFWVKNILKIYNTLHQEKILYKVYENCTKNRNFTENFQKKHQQKLR